jgi:Putative transposase
MTLATHEFIRRFLIHVLPAGFHRIRYYGLLASGQRAENVARAREARCNRAAAEMVTRPGRSTVCQRAALPDWNGSVRRRASSQSQAQNTWS